MYLGSSILISRSAASTASQATSATAMACVLLLAMFDPQTLLSSNLKGGTSKRATGDDATRFQELDEAKLEAIYNEI